MNWLPNYLVAHDHSVVWMVVAFDAIALAVVLAACVYSICRSCAHPD